MDSNKKDPANTITKNNIDSNKKKTLQAPPQKRVIWTATKIMICENPHKKEYMNSNKKDNLQTPSQKRKI